MLASRLRLCRGCLRRSVWNERPPTGDLWRDATLVRAAFSRDVAGIFLTGKHYRDGWILASRAVDSYGDALLPTVPACPAAGDLAGPSSESSPARRRLSSVCFPRAGGDCPGFAGSVGALVRSCVAKLLGVPAARGVEPPR